MCKLARAKSANTCSETWFYNVVTEEGGINKDCHTVLNFFKNPVCSSQFLSTT